MNTVFINGRFLSQRVTGVQRYAREVLLALDRVLAERGGPSSFELKLLAPPGTPLPPLEVIRAECVGPLQGHAWEQFTLPLLTRGSLLYSFSATGPLLKVRQVVTIHDASVCVVPEAFTWRFRLWYKLLLRTLVKRVPCVMTVSRFARGDIERHFGCPPRKLRVGVEGWQHLQRHAPDPGILEKYGLRPHAYVLAVSSPTPNKNFGLIVRAVGLLDNPGFDIVIAGHGDAAIFDVQKTPQSSTVKHVGYVTDGELRALYEHAGVFVYPSFYEGFGIPVIEAMASGCPVIASNAASLPEVCGDAALYVSPDDPDALARSIVRVMNDENERSRLVREGQARIERYSWRSAAELNLACIEELTTRAADQEQSYA